MDKADAAALEAYPKRKDGRVRHYTCTDDDVRRVYAQGYRKATKKCHGCFDRDEVYRQGLLKGAKEIAEEGRSQIVKRGLATMKVVIEFSEETLDNLGVEIGEEVVVQIRKKA